MGGAPVLIVGCGPVGMTLALELARHEVPSTIVDRKPGLERSGSRAIVIARHTIETFRLLGCGDEVLAKGVALRRARTYFREQELFSVELPVEGIPRFVNLQQTHTEAFLYARVAESALIDVRWGEELTELPAGWVVGCDGARSTVRRLLGVEFEGRSFDDRFLIADIRADLPFPEERRFYFDPPWNPGRQVLIHPQPDGEWRIDWQVPRETEAEEERRSGRLDERIRQIVGDTPYELAWLTGYRFHERLASSFRVGRAFLAGDAAHLMAPFGARGMNSGVEDARNLGWKLARVWRGEEPEALLDTYETERRAAARENIAVTSATMRFMAPPTAAHRLLRNAILRGSVRSRRLRARVNSGRLAERAVYEGEPPVGTYVGNDTTEFATTTIGGREYLVRPDGYVASRDFVAQCH